MNDYGTDVAIAAVARSLDSLLPKVDVDWKVIAAEVVDAVDLRAVDAINAREKGLQEALQATMAYLGGVIDDLRNRIARLEDERRSWQIERAKIARESPDA